MKFVCVLYRLRKTKIECGLFVRNERYVHDMYFSNIDNIFHHLIFSIIPIKACSYY